MADLARLALSSLNGGIANHNLLTRQKMTKAGEVTVTNTTGATIPHGVDGYIPMVKLWAEQITGEITQPVLVASFTAYHSRYNTVAQSTDWYLTATDLVIPPLSYGTSLKIYYRIYAL